MEADFTREYGVNLVTELPRMSWRRFLALVRGFSTGSVTITALARRTTPGGDGQTVNTVEGPKAAQQAFVALFGRGRRKR